MSKDEQKEEKRAFKVEDRRRFLDTGEARPDTPAETAAPEPAPAESPQPKGSTAPSPSPSAPHEAVLPLNFSTFILSLSTQALAHLGEIPNPLDNHVAVDLVAAKHMIDILGILKDKTKGNLDTAESGLLDTALYDLRLKYVERVRGRS